MGFREMDALSSFLKVIETPLIETIKIRYNWIWHPFYSTLFDGDLKDVVQEIAKLGAEGSFPKILKKIHLEGSWYTSPSLPAEPPEWFQDIFSAILANDIQLQIEPVALQADLDEGSGSISVGHRHLFSTYNI